MYRKSEQIGVRMQIAIHQPNYCPWFPYFRKMAQCDVFVIMIHCQFEKNGWQNRCKVNDKYWTMPVTKGNIGIKDKVYFNKDKLINVNIPLIVGMARMLGIKTEKIRLDFATERKGTDRIIEICDRYGCDEYLTNPKATDKYLDEHKMKRAGIELVPFEAKYQKHVFEMFNEMGRRENDRMFMGLGRFFEYLNNTDFLYVVLRNFENLPDDVEVGGTL